MGKIRVFLLIFLVMFSLMNPELVQSEQSIDKTYIISENIKNIRDFLKKQNYFDNISKICHEDECFVIDVHDLERSILNIEEKMYERIKMEQGEDRATEVQLKGFSITKILTH